MKKKKEATQQQPGMRRKNGDRSQVERGGGVKWVTRDETIL